MPSTTTTTTTMFVSVAVATILLSLGFTSTALVLPLERVYPGLGDHTIGMEVHRAHDRARHARLLRGRHADGAARFKLHGDPNISSMGRGELKFFDVANSTTAHRVSCSDPSCPSSSKCQQKTHECGYSISYMDGSDTSGSYVSDLIHLDMISGHSKTTDSSASVVFGCCTERFGDLMSSYQALDGIFGLSQQRSSVVSQLASRGITPWAFSHCLNGADNGGGVLVLGEILNPSIVYTPLVPSQPHYDVNLHSISINDHPLPIDQAVFTTSDDKGAIFDSGTLLAYLPIEAYDSFVSAISAAVSQSPVNLAGDQCYSVNMSVKDIFPRVSLNFAGGASMVLSPEEYLTARWDDARMWCLGFQKSVDGTTTLGDLILKDKIVVYDLRRQRIGWAKYNCSLPVNVSFSSSRRHSLFEALVLQGISRPRITISSSRGSCTIIIPSICSQPSHSLNFQSFFQQIMSGSTASNSHNPQRPSEGRQSPSHAKAAVRNQFIIEGPPSTMAWFHVVGEPKLAAKITDML